MKPRGPLLVTNPARPAFGGERHSGQHQHHRGVSRAYKDDQPGLRSGDLLAEVLRRAADHQASEEHGDQRDHDHAVQAGSQPSEDHLAQQHVHQEHQHAQGLVGTVHRVVRAGRAVRRDHRREDRAADAESHFLPLHVPARHMEVRELRRGRGLGEITQRQTANEQHDHHRQQYPAGARSAGHVAERDR